MFAAYEVNNILLGNCTGIIDPVYHDEIKIPAWNCNHDTVVEIQPGERIAQMVLQQIAQVRLGEAPTSKRAVVAPVASVQPVSVYEARVEPQTMLSPAAIGRMLG
mgnify:FL=1